MESTTGRDSDVLSNHSSVFGLAIVLGLKEELRASIDVVDDTIVVSASSGRDGMSRGKAASFPVLN